PDQALQDLPPPDQGQDDRQPRPDVVEGDDQGAEAEAEKALHEHPGATLPTQPGEELDPALRLHDMRDADAKKADGREDFGGLLHGPPRWIPSPAPPNG